MDEEISLPALESFATAIGPAPDDVLTEMGQVARDRSFPYVGPAVGGWCQILAGLVDAGRVLEFGSGFGYSAYWFARGLGPDGTVVLTETDADLLDEARAYFARGGLSDRARFEHGDAVEIAADVDGPVDVVLLDHEKERYTEGFEAIRDAIPRGGVVLADNVITAGHIDFATVRALVSGDEAPDAGAGERGIAAYLERIGGDDDFETVLLPLGEGVSVSRRTG